MWKAQAIGKGSKGLREYLEKNYKEEMDVRQSIKLAVETLLEVVENSKSIEICVIHANAKIEHVEDQTVEKFVKEIEKEREEE